MRINKFINVPAEILESVQCNKCGKKVTIDDLDPVGLASTEFHDIHLECGYGSKYDGVTFDFDLCDDCLNQFFLTLKIEPDSSLLY